MPLADFQQPIHLRQLEEWLHSYRPDELFDANGALLPDIAALAPTGHRRMSANPHGNGGALLRPLDLPRFADYAVKLEAPGSLRAEATRVLGTFFARRDEKQPGLEQLSPVRPG